VNVARSPTELERRPRAVAIGTFDGVHLGHRRVIQAALDAGPLPTVVTFDPHPRTALGNQVLLLSTVERRLELLAALGVEETLVVRFDLELARLAPEEFAERVLRPIGTETVFAGRDFRFGRGRSGDLALLERLGFGVRPVDLLEGVSSSEVRHRLQSGDVAGAAELLGRPPEVEGTVVSGDARGGTLGFPTANLAVPPELLVPAYGIYAGAALDRRAAISIGTNPHYGGDERRVEAFLLDFEGDLYGRRLVVELWRRLRDERAFATERELVAQIAQDVKETRAAARPA
jgi:riboflavin kinase/FMN adenylyltransferase